ncbi:MAG: hypothetical protein H0X16_01975, partial [Chloroflexi bacterium]|nr:hypothetical protein [Chloroflexota bacterium]HEV8054477.1 hypothetical protein [Candidatus Limnocylindrales bacterium]
MPNPSEGAAAPERVWPRPSFWRRTPAPAAVASALSLALILVPNPSTSARAPEPIATLVPAAFAPVAGTRPEAGADLIGAAAAPGAASRLSAGASERPQAAPSEPVVDDQRPLSAPLGERLPDPSIGRENRPPAAGAVGDSLLVPTPTPTPVATPRPVAVAPA